MPLVGMRRITRVFGARVLRSGRQLWTELHEDKKYTRAIDRGNEVLDNCWDGVQDAGNHCKDRWLENESDAPLEIVAEHKIEQCVVEGVMEVESADRIYGNVYRRKRKRMESKSTNLMEDKRFEKQYVRSRWRKRCRPTELYVTCGELRDLASLGTELCIVASESSFDSGYRIACFLNSVLKYISRAWIELEQLFAFMHSEPIFSAYSSCGVLFLQDSTSIKKPGICTISGSRSFLPVFNVDFSAIPFCFILLHSRIYLRYAHLSCVFVTHSLGVNEDVGKVKDVADDEEHSSQTPSGRDKPDCGILSFQIPSGRVQSDCNKVASGIDDSGVREMSHSAVGFPKSPTRNMHLRNGRNIRTSQRCKRGRPPSSFRTKKADGSLVSDFLRCRHDGSHSTPVGPTRVLRTSFRRSCTANIKELKSTLGGVTQDMSATICSANILIIEMDKCYREEGASVTLELAASKQWFLAITRDGIRRYSIKPERVMRPSSCNIFTHSVIWTMDSCWKLEFPNKQNWWIFKELYKECLDRNMQAPAASVIPVPWVHEVLLPVDSSSVPYVRPDSYITVKEDELARALLKKTNYDMDSEDEEWLSKFNNEFYAEKETHELVTPENFELIIDVLEKGFYCNPDDYSDEKAADNICVDLKRRQVVEVVRDYWIKKRKRRCSALVRIFQLYQPRRTLVIPKSVLRKKRSFKRQGSQVERGKPRTFLQAMSVERDALEQQNKFLKVQEAKAAANKSEELAVVKRQRAQFLMANADLATYKAMAAVRMAEAAKIHEPPGTI
ncbi:Enhancer of polycomb-like transcription factor protein [Forsythia ovata]|uniref:Enhancer of polycomb-like protein n=1 Tax=Forsythia ovata TaxID=205694 RepID=A0ABD1WI83_9LAMI